MGNNIFGAFCRIHEHKDIVKELENTDLLQSLILDKFNEKMHGSPTLSSKGINFFLFYDLGNIFLLFFPKLEKLSLSLHFIFVT